MDSSCISLYREIQELSKSEVKYWDLFGYNHVSYLTVGMKDLS